MAGLFRIVLPDPRGDELFAGASTPSPVRAPPAAEEEEPCPDTLRSSEWPCAGERPSGRRPIEVTFADGLELEAGDGGFEAA